MIDNWIPKKKVLWFQNQFYQEIHIYNAYTVYVENLIWKKVHSHLNTAVQQSSYTTILQKKIELSAMGSFQLLSSNSKRSYDIVM